MDGNNAVHKSESERKGRDEAWSTTHSATGVDTSASNEGSRLVVVVSSRMAIPSLV